MHLAVYAHRCELEIDDKTEAELTMTVALQITCPAPHSVSNVVCQFFMRFLLYSGSDASFSSSGAWLTGQQVNPINMKQL